MSIAAERLMVEVQADVRDALRKLDQVEAKSASTSSRISKMAKGMGLAFGGAAIVGGIKKTIDLAMNFDATMRQVGVQTEQSGKQLSKLSDLALKMGKDTVYSAQDASGAMLELAKGGMNAAQIKAGALKQTMRLAAAGGVELGDAAGYIVQGLNTYGLKAKQAAQVTTALAGGANASTASVSSLGQALSQVGPGAVNAGMNIQETVAALAAFDNAGIKGSDAGTSLKTMLASLVPSTLKAKNAMKSYGLEFVKRNGDFKSMTQIAGELKKGLGDVGQAERVAAMKTIFGSDATRAATVLMKEGTKGIQGYIKATKDQKKTQEMANASMKGASGAWNNLTGTVETAAIQIGQKLLPAFTKAANKGADFVNQATTWGPQIQESFGWTIDVAKDLMNAMEPLVSLAEGAAKAWSGLPGPVKEVATQVGLAALVFPRLAAAATTAGGTVVGSLTTMQAKVAQFRAELSYSATRMQAIGGVARQIAGPAGFLAIAAGAQSSNKAVKGLTSVLGAAAIGFSVGGPIGAAVGGLGAGFLEVLHNSHGAGEAARKAYAQIAAIDPVKNAKASLDDLKASLDQVTGAYTANTRAAVLSKLQESGMIETGQKYGISARAMVNAAMGIGRGLSGARPVMIDYQNQIKEITKQQEALATAKDSQGRLKYSDGMGNFTAEGQKMAESLMRQKRALQANLAELKMMPGALRKDAQEVRNASAATADYSGKLKGIRPKIRTQIEQVGIVPSIKGVATIAAGYHLIDKKHVRTLIEAAGMEPTKKGIAQIIALAKDLEKHDPTVTTALDDQKLRRTYGSVRGLLDALGRVVTTPKADLNDGPAKAKGAALSHMLDVLGGKNPTPTASLRDLASGGIARVSGELANLNGKSATVTTYQRFVQLGVNAGMGLPLHKAAGGYISGPGTATSDSIPAMLSNGEYVMDAATTKRALPLIKAIHAAKGRVFGYASGGQVGSTPGAPSAPHLTDAQKKAQDAAKARKAAAKELLKGMVHAIREGVRETQKTFRKLDAMIAKNMHGKAQEMWLKRSHAIQSRLVRLGEHQERIQKHLADAQDKLANIRQAKSSFVSSVRQGISSQATVLNAGNSASAIATNLGAQAAKVKTFAHMLQKLRKMGYSDGIVKQVAAAGVEGGWDAATALLQATKAQVKSISRDYASINQTAKDTANKLGSQMYDSGIRAAQGLVKGLKDRRKDIEDTITAIAMGMQKALKKALGIHSPSRVMARLMDYTVDGWVNQGKRREADVRKGGMGLGAAHLVGMTHATSKGPSVAALNGGLRAGASVSFTFVTHNPQAEPQSRTTNKALAKVASLGLV